jgi:hypothetical protein
MRLIGVLAAGMLLFGLQAGWHGARADCDSGLRQLRDTVDKLPVGRVKMLTLFDIDRAQREDDEADEIECAEALNHAQRILRTMLP